MTTYFDYLVIGKGLMGTAATRYLSQAAARVAVIGPDEPLDPTTHAGVFASHYDQGRITRRLSQDIVWATLAQRAIDQYALIAEKSGLQFYHPVGGLYMAPRQSKEPYLASVAAIGRHFNVEYVPYDDDSYKQELPFLNFPAHCHGLLERPPAGYINPRELIKAQLAIAVQQGATIIRETAAAVAVSSDGIAVTTQAGHTYQAAKVLIAAGAYTNCFDLLPRKLALRVKSETIILARVPDAEADRLQGMPTVIYQIESPAIDSIYLLPPIRYPDGYYYIKMGCNTIADKTLPTFADMHHWCAHGNSDEVKAEMRAALLAIIPGLQASSFVTRRCLVTYTPHGRPFIDAVAGDRLFVATGGNGSAAKCADTLGNLAARLMQNLPWPADLGRSLFKVIT